MADAAQTPETKTEAATGKSALSMPESVKPAVNLAVQVFVGSLGFALIFLVAVALSAFVKSFGSLVPDWVLTVTDYFEKGLFAVDLLCLGLFIIAEAIRFIRALRSAK